MLAIVRKLIILALGGGELGDPFAFAAIILALGTVYWCFKDREARD
jgi:hypothetical protein